MQSVARAAKATSRRPVRQVQGVGPPWAKRVWEGTVPYLLQAVQRVRRNSGSLK